MILIGIQKLMLVSLAGLCFAGLAAGQETRKYVGNTKLCKAEVKAAPKAKKTDKKTAKKPFDNLRHEKELYEWLTPNFPEEAKKLEMLKAKNFDVYRKQFLKKWRKFRRIIETGQKHPELGKSLTTDLKLVIEQDKILEKISIAKKDEKRKAEYTAELKEIVSQRFDLGIKIKKMQYEILHKKIEQLIKGLAGAEEDTKKQIANREGEIANRIKSMLETEKREEDLKK